MKAWHHFSIFNHLLVASLTLTFTCNLIAEEPTPPPQETAPQSESTANKPSSAPSSPTGSVRGSELIPQALQLYLAKKYNESIQVIDQILKINPDYTDAHNLKGASYTKMKNWTAAEACFRQALSAAPGAFEPRFNLAELTFLQGKYPEARQAFTSIMQYADQDIYKHLTEFKILLTYLLEGNIESARSIADQYDGFETTPVYYFTRGALSYKEGNRAKAMEYFDSAARIFPARLNHPYADTLIELGWIQVNEKGLLDDPDAPKRGSSIFNTQLRNRRAANTAPAQTPVGNIPAENTPKENEDIEIKNPFKDHRNNFRQEFDKN